MASTEQAASNSDLSTANEAIAGQYLTFMLSGEEYGVEILRVQEIKGWKTATIIPNVPDYILGVINLRGEIVPVMDLRRRFGLEPSTYGPTTVVIVVRVTKADRTQTIGLMVDAVSEVYRVEGTQIQPSPDFGGSISAEFVKGLATVGDKMLILLEIDKLANFELLEHSVTE